MKAYSQIQLLSNYCMELAFVQFFQKTYKNFKKRIFPFRFAAITYSTISIE